MGRWFDKWGGTFFAKYTDDELERDTHRYTDDGTGILWMVTRQFFDEIMHECVGRSGHGVGEFPDVKTPMDALRSDAFMSYVFDYIYSHRERLFHGVKERKTIDSDLEANDFVNIRKFFSFHRPRKVAQFPSKMVRLAVKRLFPDHDAFCSPLNFHDSSCGFGMREACALLSNFSYYGTDPNAALCLKLNEMGDALKRLRSDIVKGKRDIRCQGSETFIPEWEGIMDISLSSPPYFNLEIYSEDGCKSTSNYGDYGRWLEEYSLPTLKNCVRYLKKGGWLCINIKNLRKHRIYDDYVKIVESFPEMEMQEPMVLVMDYQKMFEIKCLSERLCDLEGYGEKMMVAKKIA